MNYQLELDKILASLEGRVPRLLLHSCCAPCSSYCLEYLRRYFNITVFYYNPNITRQDEYRKRESEEIRLINELNKLSGNKIDIIKAPYDPDRFLEMSKGLENVPEGGERCFACFGLRLEVTGMAAAKGGYDFFTTTLSISPLKNAQKLNEIGLRVGDKVGVKYLVSDFKKKGGYQRSIELSKEYNLYRQDYCGCDFSKQERERQKGLMSFEKMMQ
ncbi:MAG: epoxyqueuosine reductase QueH [Lachnospiraceae bacterium]|nr:epoxyqueuosine reductase QueH [Candidatus Merdinaster equi]